MPILDEQTLDFISHGAEQTQRFGARMGALLQAGDVICLEGDLGTGKTCFAQGVGLGMGIAQPVTSPSFTLISEYQPPPPTPVLYHVDLYRLDRIEEVIDLGLDDYLYGKGVCVVEWAEKALAVLPEEHLLIEMGFLADTSRGLGLRPSGDRYLRMLSQLRQRTRRWKSP